MYIKLYEHQIFLTRISEGFDKDSIKIILRGTKKMSTYTSLYFNNVVHVIFYIKLNLLKHHTQHL